MKKNQSFLLLISIVLFAMTARASDGRSEPCLIQGHVMDAITKKPVSGVVVSVTGFGANNPKEVITDADGFFYFTDLPSSQVNLRFGKKGYQQYKRACILAKERTTLKITVEFLPDDMKGIPDPDDDSEYPLLRMLDAR